MHHFPTSPPRHTHKHMLYMDEALACLRLEAMCVYPEGSVGIVGGKSVCGIEMGPFKGERRFEVVLLVR